LVLFSIFGVKYSTPLLCIHHRVPTVLLSEERGKRCMGHSPASYSYGRYKGVIAEWRGGRRRRVM